VNPVLIKELIAQIPTLRRFAMILTGNVHNADALVKNTLEYAVSNINLLGTDDLRLWIFSVLHSIRSTELRRAIKYPTVSPLGIVSEPQMGLQMLINQLPEDQRIVLLLVSLEDMSYEQVAFITSVTSEIVVSRLSQARGELQELLVANTEVELCCALDNSCKMVQ
jgi:DNA-directed RNA polymerase specialized sigma24 family protein